MKLFSVEISLSKWSIQDSKLLEVQGSRAVIQFYQACCANRLNTLAVSQSSVDTTAIPTSLFYFSENLSRDCFILSHVDEYTTPTVNTVTSVSRETLYLYIFLYHIGKNAIKERLMIYESCLSLYIHVRVFQCAILTVNTEYNGRCNRWCFHGIFVSSNFTHLIIFIVIILRIIKRIRNHLLFRINFTLETLSFWKIIKNFMSLNSINQC